MNELDDLRHKFGDRVVRIIQNSPLLMRDLRRLYGRGVHVRRINGTDTAYSQARTKDHPAGLICIGSRACPMDKVLFLAHEAYHILYGTTPPPNHRYISRKSYVARAVAEEARAMIHETKVAEELWESGYKLAFKHMSYLASYLRGGYSEVRSMIEREISSVSNTNYRQYYQKIYDRAA
jgi:capsular polysaccharide biosynthesis protein